MTIFEGGGGAVFTKKFCKLNWLAGAIGTSARAITRNQISARHAGGIHRPKILRTIQTIAARIAACAERFSSKLNHAGPPGMENAFISLIAAGFFATPPNPPRSVVCFRRNESAAAA